MLGLTALPFVVGTLLPGGLPADVVTRFQDPAIVESSGLAVVDGLLVTTNDSGDSGRVFSVDPGTGRTVGVTVWSSEPDDVEALAPAGAGEVWVGDIGDNRADRTSVSVSRVPVGSQQVDVDVPSYELVYPGGPRDAESLLADPTTGRLYVISKGVLGGMLYAAPAELSSRRPNRIEEVGPVLGIATDAAFFPDGRHLVVRSYSEAAVYSWPELDEVGRFGLPHQQQGEGIAVADDGTIYLSSEGLRAPVLRVTLPGAVRRAMEPASPEASPSTSPSASPSATDEPDAEDSPAPAPGNDVDDEQTSTQRSPWPWALGGLAGVGIVVILVRALRPR